jgi:serine/threonine-protein kinase
MGADLQPTPDVVQRATVNSLRRAEELRLHTLALPAFGTGAGRMDPKDSAEAMIGGLRAHLAATPESKLRRVHLVLFHEDAYQAFSSHLGLSKARRAS